MPKLPEPTGSDLLLDADGNIAVIPAPPDGTTLATLLEKRSAEARRAAMSWDPSGQLSPEDAASIATAAHLDLSPPSLSRFAELLGLTFTPFQVRVAKAVQRRERLRAIRKRGELLRDALKGAIAAMARAKESSEQRTRRRQGLIEAAGHNAQAADELEEAQKLIQELLEALG